jgi:hypothetical protein
VLIGEAVALALGAKMVNAFTNQLLQFLFRFPAACAIFAQTGSSKSSSMAHKALYPILQQHFTFNGGPFIQDK